MPVAIHTGDPKAFWQPPDEKNERIDELRAHPDWSFFGEPVPSWQELYAQFERRVARHPKTIFIGVHFGNDPEDPANVGRMLDKYPNLYIDTAARVPEIGRQDAAKMRQFFEKYQDRILFGTDLGVGPTQDDMMYGSNGALPPTLDDERRYFESTWRYFETERQAVRIADAHPGALEDRRYRPVRAGFAQTLLRERRPTAEVETAHRPTPEPAAQAPSPSSAPTK